MDFSLLKTTDGSEARAAVIETDRGSVETPIFMPVGTVGSVKAVWPHELRTTIDAPIILGNSYHLYLRPGTELLEKAGGLHAFMGWDRPILTDSGGYQVFSLAERRKITEEGVEFQSHIDGSRHHFSAESVIDIQRSIGSDIMMVLDECPPGDADRTYAARSNERTLRWASRCRNRFAETENRNRGSQALFGIVQGVVYSDIRKESAKQLVDLDFPGYAIGGLSVGEPAHQMYELVEVVNEILPRDRPRYLMGVGTPANLIENIDRGIDMFDCVMPTRNGRNGMLFTHQGVINIRNRKWRDDFSPVDPELINGVSNVFTKAYLRHLFIAGEILGLQIASVHNLSFYLALMRQARRAIMDDRFRAWKSEILPRIDRRL